MPSTLIQTLSTAFDTAKDQLADTPLYLACSGGRDSLALAFACHQLYTAGQIARLPILLHVHHGWQSANDDWADLVANWAVEYGFDCRILRVNLPKNSETAARSARYQAFATVMIDGGVLLLAHHANDQAETVLMRLIDGAGVQGLSAMKIWQDKTIAIDEHSNKTISLWRPWLGVSRDVITQFARAHQLPFVDDATNTDAAFVRGILRAQVLPILQSINPKAIDNIARSAQLLAQTADWQAESVAESVASFTTAHLPYQSVLNIATFNQLPKSTQSSSLHQWLQGDEPLPPSFATTQSVLSLLNRADNDHESQILWQGKRHAYVICRYDDYLYRYRADVWRLFTSTAKGDDAPMSSCDGWHWQLINDEQCHLVFNTNKPIKSLVPVSRMMSITIGKHSYKGKKLAQKLRLPPWLRTHLWQAVIDGGDGEDETWLIAPMMAWRLPTGEQVTMDNFAPIGTMVYNE